MPALNREMAERSKAAVLKTVEVKASWGSNPYLPATTTINPKLYFNFKISHFIYANFHLMLFAFKLYFTIYGVNKQLEWHIRKRMLERYVAKKLGFR